MNEINRQDDSRTTRMLRRIASIFASRRKQDELAGGPSLLDWGQKYLPRHFTLESSAMHRWMEAEMDAMQTTRGAKINVIGPRGGAKSTIGTLACVLRAAVHNWEPYIWIVSDTKQQACSHLDNVKVELVDNEILARDYPQAVGEGKVWRNNSIRLKNSVAVEAFGTGQKIRGRRRRAKRPTLIVCDDLQNDQHTESALQRDRSRRWFQGTLLKAGTKRTNIVNLATALHREALALLLDRTPGWKSKIFRAIVEWPRNMSLWHEWEQIYCDVENPKSKEQAQTFYEDHREAMHEGATLLWPEEEDLYTLMCMRVEGGRRAFEREKQGSPINPELCEWPESYFDQHIWFDQWPRNLKIKTLALDPSKGSDARRGDYSAFVMLGIDTRGVLYVEADMARRPTPQIVADGVELYQKFQPDAFGIESNQYQELLGAEFEAEFKRQDIVAARPWTLNNRVNKRVRIRRLGPYLSSHRLRFKENSSSTQLLLNQLKDFPSGDHGDGTDATEMAIRLTEQINQDARPVDNLGDRLV